MLYKRKFQKVYAGKAPWDIGKAQKLFSDVADRIFVVVLDAGCGSGDTALSLAGRVAVDLPDPGQTVSQMFCCDFAGHS